MKANKALNKFQPKPETMKILNQSFVVSFSINGLNKFKQFIVPMNCELFLTEIEYEQQLQQYIEDFFQQSENLERSICLCSYVGKPFVVLELRKTSAKNVMFKITKNDNQYVAGLFGDLNNEEIFNNPRDGFYYFACFKGFVEDMDIGGINVDVFSKTNIEFMPNTPFVFDSPNSIAISIAITDENSDKIKECKNFLNLESEKGDDPNYLNVTLPVGWRNNPLSEVLEILDLSLMDLFKLNQNVLHKLNDMGISEQKGIDFLHNAYDTEMDFIVYF